MAKKDFRNGLQSRLNDLEVKVQDLNDGVLQSDEIACDTIVGATAQFGDIRLSGVSGNVLEVKVDDETPAIATLSDAGALEVAALTIGGEAVTPGGGAALAHDWSIEPKCGSDAASSGVNAFDYVPIAWFKKTGLTDGSYVPADNVPFTMKAQIAVARGGSATAFIGVVDASLFAYYDGNFDACLTGRDGLVQTGGDPFSNFTAYPWSDGDDDYVVIAAAVKRGTTEDIANDLFGGFGVFAPLPYEVRVNWIVEPNYPEGFVEDEDYGYGAPPGFPATLAEFFDVTPGEFPSPISLWKLPSPIAAGSYEEGASVNMADLVTGNALPWYATEVRVRLTVSGGADANVGAWVPRYLAHTAFATLDAAAVLAIGLDQAFDIYVEYKSPDTAATVRGDFAQSILVASGGGA